VLKQRRVRLRPKRLDDATQDYAWAQDRELCELEAAFPVSVPFADYLRMYSLDLRLEPQGCLRFAIETIQGEHIGNCMCYQMDETKGEAEIGILIGNKAYWDQGYGMEALELILEHVFATTAMERLYLHTLTWNYRAQRCFAKCGFTPCAEEPRWGRRFLVMDIDRQRWMDRRQMKGPPPYGRGGPHGLGRA
jgi:RimJ/RimL family protein N-acetyltransferase